MEDEGVADRLARHRLPHVAHGIVHFVLRRDDEIDLDPFDGLLHLAAGHNQFAPHGFAHAHRVRFQDQVNRGGPDADLGQEFFELRMVAP